MTKNNLYHGARKLRSTGALMLALALATFPMAFSRAVKAQAPAKPTSQTPVKPAGESMGVPKEGIKVHGHWTIDVRNPDGTLVTHREFENALINNGAVFLARVLGRQATTGFWTIRMGHATTIDSSGLPIFDNQSPWLDDLGFIEEPSSFGPGSVPGTGISNNLSVSAPGNKLILSGSLEARQNGSINVVGTMLSTCSNTVSPSSCDQPGGTTSTLFTIKYPLDNPVSGIVEGQIVQVTVVISFS